VPERFPAKIDIFISFLTSANYIPRIFKKGKSMENEYQVLSALQNNERISQRAIAESTGISLGAVNILIKKMVRRGLIKIEQLNSRNMRYILTPQGIQEKARLTYAYICQSYRQLMKINRVLDNLISDYKLLSDGQPIFVFGPADEMREVITQYLLDRNLNYRLPKSLETIYNHEGRLMSGLILVWRKEEEEALHPESSAVNIMQLL
jgi:DNA-binding MarR family transcriptional regulator